MDNKVRIQKLLSNQGICSRRHAEQLILEKRIKVNNKIIDELGFKCSICDIIEIDNKQISLNLDKKKIYLLLNKPLKYITSLSDPQNRKTISELIPSNLGRLYPIGRLDYNTHGLIILTNDGELTNKLIRPATTIEKEYIAKCKNPSNGNELLLIKRGVYIEQLDYIPKVIDAKVIDSNNKTSTYSITLKEGKKREIRLLLKKLNHEVIDLERVRIGSIHIGDLKIGQYRFLKEDEIKSLKNDKI